MTALLDRPRSLIVTGLQGGARVTVSATTERPDGLWRAEATFHSDQRGRLDLSRSAPLTGSYSGAHALGLLWSEHMVAQTSASGRLNLDTVLRVSAGGRTRATATLVQTAERPGVVEERLRPARAGFFGDYFAARSPRRGPAVVWWGGSEGGLNPQIPALMASHGIPALGLAYFGLPGLPSRLSEIPLEYFVRAVRWLRSQPTVDPRRIWLMSASRGTEAELLVAFHWPTLVHGVVAASASAFTYGGSCPSATRSSIAACPAWTLHGRSLPSAVVIHNADTTTREGTVDALPGFKVGLYAQATALAAIPDGRYRGAILLITGGQDEQWPSTTYASRIIDGVRHDPATHAWLNFPRAGHTVFSPPFTPPLLDDVTPAGTISLGGTAASDESARENDWPAARRFIQEH